MRKFANGYEGDAWTEVWCSRCNFDHGSHDGSYDEAEICVLMERYLCLNEVPIEWVDHPDAHRHLPRKMDCTRFTPCIKCGAS